MFDFPPLRALGAMTAVAVLLSGCSINGNYPDAVEPDAAKLRFISDLDSSTLSLFDNEHCGGRTTGMLNNLFVANTKRRADMTIAPPADAGPYLEIRLKPGAEQFIQANTQGRSTICTTRFNFTPQSGAEYELTFDYKGRYCTTSLKRLHQVNGQVVRSPIPLIEKGLPACAGSNAMFPAVVKAQPDTPERTAMIEQIVEVSIIADMQPQPDAVDPAVIEQTVDKVVEERKQRVGFTLPDAYWQEYRQHIATMASDGVNSKARALELYKDEYRTRLKRLDTDELRKLVPDSDTNDLTLALTTNNAMLQHYQNVRKDVLRESLSAHLSRMADLDKRYAVCDRFAGCWKN
ncbi:MAG: hypothetical protein ACN6O6_01090 [Pseudomonas sp.]|uniref:hypothetical protein n=1 Tax=Pseudomonas sp. TaxID=306 RepID=UPI003D106C22